MKCELCKGDIEVHELSGWDKGHNGLPLVDGRVCDACNMRVIEERIMRVSKGLPVY